jgi:murein DD-endopeptidase MepM/ murein hydrolase activator NlpD
MSPRSITAVAVLFAALATAPAGLAYPWPLKPFDKPHPIRGSFGDPRYHLGAEGERSAFHSGVDIAARDGTKVYSVEPGYVHAYAATVTVTSRTGREFGYWHIKPVVRTGMHVRRHQLLGRIRTGWGHVHFAESRGGHYNNPLRKGALTPYVDHTTPVVESIVLLSAAGTAVDPHNASGTVTIVSSIYDPPQIAPPPPWDVARLAPSMIWWSLNGNGVAQSALVADFGAGLPPSFLYSLVYAPGTWQNKAHRPGRYLYRSVLDTTTLPNGTYSLQVAAMDTRHNVGSATIELRTANLVAAP